MSDEPVRVELSDGLQGAKLFGELDLAVYEKLCAELTPLFESTGDLRLDLSEVEFLDSSGIRFSSVCNSPDSGQGAVVLQAPQPHVARVLAVAGVSELGIRVENHG